MTISKAASQKDTAIIETTGGAVIATGTFIVDLAIYVSARNHQNIRSNAISNYWAG